MDLDFSPEDLAFQGEVRAFIKQAFDDDMRAHMAQSKNGHINKDGQIFWNLSLVTNAELLERLKAAAVQKPQPEVHVRADQMTRYEKVGTVILTAQRAGIQKVGFITEPGPTGSQY